MKASRIIALLAQEIDSGGDFDVGIYSEDHQGVTYLNAFRPTTVKVGDGGVILLDTGAFQPIDSGTSWDEVRAIVERKQRATVRLAAPLPERAATETWVRTGGREYEALFAAGYDPRYTKTEKGESWTKMFPPAKAEVAPEAETVVSPRERVIAARRSTARRGRKGGNS